jgi:hypothetical protein
MTETQPVEGPLNLEDELRLREEMLGMGQVLPHANVSSARALAASIEENRQRAVLAAQADRQRTATANEAANQRTAAQIEAYREIANKGLEESRKSSTTAMRVALVSLLIALGSLLLTWWGSRGDKVWMESELAELKATNTRLESLNAGYSKTMDFQEKQLQALKSLVLALKHQRTN